VNVVQGDGSGKRLSITNGKANKLSDFLSSSPSRGKLTLSVVADFLESVGLKHTLSVLMTEASQPSLLEREELAQSLKVSPSSSGPLLSHLLDKASRILSPLSKMDGESKSSSSSPLSSPVASQSSPGHSHSHSTHSVGGLTKAPSPSPSHAPRPISPVQVQSSAAGYHSLGSSAESLPDLRDVLPLPGTEVGTAVGSGSKGGDISSQRTPTGQGPGSIKGSPSPSASASASASPSTLAGRRPHLRPLSIPSVSPVAGTGAGTGNNAITDLDASYGSIASITSTHSSPRTSPKNASPTGRSPDTLGGFSREHAHSHSRPGLASLAPIPGSRRGALEPLPAVGALPSTSTTSTASAASGSSPSSSPTEKPSAPIPISSPPTPSSDSGSGSGLLPETSSSPVALMAAGTLRDSSFDSSISGSGAGVEVTAADAISGTGFTGSGSLSRNRRLEVRRHANREGEEEDGEGEKDDSVPAGTGNTRINVGRMAGSVLSRARGTIQEEDELLSMSGDSDVRNSPIRSPASTAPRDSFSPQTSPSPLKRTSLSNNQEDEQEQDVYRTRSSGGKKRQGQDDEDEDEYGDEDFEEIAELDEELSVAESLEEEDDLSTGAVSADQSREYQFGHHQQESPLFGKEGSPPAAGGGGGGADRLPSARNSGWGMPAKGSTAAEKAGSVATFKDDMQDLSLASDDLNASQSMDLGASGDEGSFTSPLSLPRAKASSQPSQVAGSLFARRSAKPAAAAATAVDVSLERSLNQSAASVDFSTHDYEASSSFDQSFDVTSPPR